MARQSAEVTFVVSGQSLPAGQLVTLNGGTVKAAVRVGARRSGSEVVRLTARPDDDIVLLHIANGPTLYLHPEDARELLRAQVGAAPQTARGTRELPSADGEVLVPAQLGWRALDDADGQPGTRGRIASWIGDVVLDAVEIVTGLLKDKAVRMVAAEVTKKLDGQVEAGVYRLAANALTQLKGSGARLPHVPAAPRERDPILILVHGTFVDTYSTFGKLWTEHAGRVEELFKRYGGRVYALDHETVGVSPFGNALTLVRALPTNARLHLVTHSRGGIVAEVLARICGGQGVQEQDLALFAGDAYQPQRAELAELAREIEAKKIKVERIVRIACPARGTLLASRRLDAYLSVIKWGLELTGTPVLPQLVNFLAEVARRRTDPAEMPGLEAMMPDRPMAKWLSASAEPIEGELRVVAGDIEGDSLLSWLKTLLADAFYWTDNDLVVQTRSMYGGTPRAPGAASFVLDRGGKVTHFNYFSNERTAALITRALLDAQPEQFRPIGPLSWAGEDTGGTRAARAAKRSSAGKVAERPAVFVLPGILGSHLKVDSKRVWLSLRFISNLERLKWNPRTANRILADGPVGSSYDDLIDHLADSHQVIPFSFDWRRPIEDEAQRLADEVDQALLAREATGQPVRFLAHSMGGLVVRTMLLERPQTWKQCMARQGARVLMLGTPNGGSFAPMQVLSGDDSFGNLFTLFGNLFDGPGARQIIAEMPGLLQLQAGLLDGKLGLSEQAGWLALEAADLQQVNKRIAERSFWHSDALQQQALSWGIPPQSVLDRAVQLRKRLDQQRDDLGTDAANILLVVGKARATPAAVKIVEGASVMYFDARDGDGRVTLDNAVLPGVKTWHVDVAHGELADAKKAFDAYVDLLVNGDTNKLPVVTASTARGAAAEQLTALVPSRPARAMRGTAPPAQMSDVFAPQLQRDPTPATGNRLNVRIVNGNLKFVREPLLLGHYGSLKLTGTEFAIDQLLDNKMAEALLAGLYPAAVGSSQVFINSRRCSKNPLALPRPEAAIVVGLGEEGALSMSNLIETIRQGTLAYAQRLAERASGTATTFDLAATLIGSGGSAISPGTAAQALAIGVRQANLLLAGVGWPLVSRLQLIELYVDRATEALNALLSLSEGGAQDLIVEPSIVTGQGGLPRSLDAGYRSADYDFVSVRQRAAKANTEFEFALATRRARDEVRGSIAQSKLVDELVCAGASDVNDDPRIGRTLFKLLVPLELEPFLAGATSLLLQLDPETAAYPWEMLDLHRSELDRGPGTPPWAIRTRLLRKLRTTEFRAEPRTAGTDDGVLVIGEPQCPPDSYPPLPGAAAEAREVAAIFGAKPILNAEALSIVNSVLDRSYSILHVAGHGDIIEGVGGVVLSNGTTFGPREVKSMRIVPQLAFINCCHLGRFAGKPARAPAGGLPKFAANVAEQLIRIGVRCVIAAGWAVDDAAAQLFARTFYQQITHPQQPARFADAVWSARSVTHERHPQSNTWAAYQCYGDPDWIYKPAAQPDDAASKTAYVVASADALKLHLQTLLAAHRFDGLSPAGVRERLEMLANVCRGEWNGQGAVAAAFGAVHAAIGDLETALKWYSQALAAADGGAGLSTLEQFGNVRARHGEKIKNKAEILAAIELLEQVRALAPTAERESLLGSAYKRLANLESVPQQRTALEKSLEHYGAAERIARAANADDLFYPAMNRIGIELKLRAGQRVARRGFDPGDIQAIRQSLQRKNATDPNFWSAIGNIELSLYEAIALGELAPALAAILTELDDLMRRVTATLEWDSVTYQARTTLQDYLASSPTPAEQVAANELLRALLGSNAPQEKAKPETKRKKSARRKGAKSH